MPEDRTRCVLGYLVQSQTFCSILAGSHSLWSANLFVCEFLRVLFPPGLGDPAAFIKELPDDHDIVSEHILGHSDPVNDDVWANSFNPLTVSLWTAPW